MTASEELGKSHEERGIERQGVTNLWVRQWKPDLIVRVKARHEMLCDIHAERIAALQNISDPPTEDDERRCQVAESVDRLLGRVNDLMLRLALHPTPGKASQDSRGGDRPRNVDPTLEAHVVSAPIVTPTATTEPAPNPKSNPGSPTQD